VHRATARHVDDDGLRLRESQHPSRKVTIMTIGPVEYVVLGFPGSTFTGKIAPALAALTDSETIKILDLVFIAKDADGEVLAIELEEHDESDAFSELQGEIGGLISQEDIEHAAEDLEPGSSAALLIWEDTWAAPLAAALAESGGVLIEGGRIPHDLIEAALAAAG
jgi:hypothetical protein